MNDTIDKSPKTTREAFKQLISTVGLGMAVEEVDSLDDIKTETIDTEQDLVALYRLACKAGFPEARKWIFSLDDETLDYIEKQYSDQ